MEIEIVGFYPEYKQIIFTEGGSEFTYSGKTGGIYENQMRLNSARADRLTARLFDVLGPEEAAEYGLSATETRNPARQFSPTHMQRRARERRAMLSGFLGPEPVTVSEAYHDLFERGPDELKGMYGIGSENNFNELDATRRNLLGIRLTQDLRAEGLFKPTRKGRDA